MSNAPVSKSLAAIQNLIDAGRPLVYIQSSEEDRVVGVLARVAQERRTGRVDFFLWSVTEGLNQNGKSADKQPDGARGVLDFIVAHKKPAILLLKDFHEFIREDLDIRRRLRDVYYECLDKGKFAVICSPVKCLPDEIKHEVAFVELPRPDLQELEELLKAEAESISGAGTLSAETVYQLTRAVQGLTFHEARHALRRAMAEHGRLDASAVSTLEQEKQQLVRKTGLIEFVPNATGVAQIGGLEVLKTWLTERRELFFARDALSTDIVPKGLLLMGVSGCGKSLSARAVAHAFSLPLYRIDMIQVFSAGMGNAERLFSDACRSMEEVSPAVAWFDEIENGISRHHQDGSGVLDRIFGFFLTWMQEKPAGLFVAATANRIDLLPAEMIRKGRFDQVFFVDLPDTEERLEIFRIHLAHRGIDPSTFRLDLISKRTEGWSGAEIEQSVIAAMVSARLAKEPLNEEHIFLSLREIVPLSKTMKEQVGQIRSWAFDRAVHASNRKK